MTRLSALTATTRTEKKAALSLCKTSSCQENRFRQSERANDEDEKKTRGEKNISDNCPFLRSPLVSFNDFSYHAVRQALCEANDSQLNTIQSDMQWLISTHFVEIAVNRAVLNNSGHDHPMSA